MILGAIVAVCLIVIAIDAVNQRKKTTAERARYKVKQRRLASQWQYYLLLLLVILAALAIYYGNLLGVLLAALGLTVAVPLLIKVWRKL